eukprot:scaffold1108_cov260-Pinguiococcus_pyrenoidosus.AAC.5
MPLKRRSAGKSSSQRDTGGAGDAEAKRRCAPCLRHQRLLRRQSRRGGPCKAQRKQSWRNALYYVPLGRRGALHRRILSLWRTQKPEATGARGQKRQQACNAIARSSKDPRAATVAPHIHWIWRVCGARTYVLRIDSGRDWRGGSVCHVRGWACASVE